MEKKKERKKNLLAPLLPLRRFVKHSVELVLAALHGVFL